MIDVTYEYKLRILGRRPAYKITTSTTSPSTTENPFEIELQGSKCGDFDLEQFDDSRLKTETQNIQYEPIRAYQTGYNGRVRYVKAVVTSETIKRARVPINDAARDFAESMGESTDEPGLIIGYRLGGSGENLYNIYPKDHNMIGGDNLLFEELAFGYNGLKYDENNNMVIVKLYYASETITKPYKIVYAFVYDDGTCRVLTINNSGSEFNSR